MSGAYVYVAVGLVVCTFVFIQWLQHSSRKKNEEPNDYLRLYWQLRKLETLSQQLAGRSVHITEAAHRLTVAAEKLQEETVRMKAGFDNLSEENQLLLADGIKDIEYSCRKLIVQARNLESGDS